MAKRRAVKKPVVRRKRRLSGIGTGIKQTVMETLAVVAGIYISNKVIPKIVAKLPSIPEQVKQAIPIAIGTFLLPKVYKGAYSKQLSIGMNVSGVAQLLAGAGVQINGHSDDYMFELPSEIAGFDTQRSVVSGFEEMEVVAGNTDSMNGYYSEVY
jgi:hypothetical protein